MRRRRYYLIGAVLMAVALGFLLFNAFSSFSVYYYYVGEFKEKQAEIGDKAVRVAGTVADAPVTWDVSSRTTSFTLTDGENDLYVAYTGSVPDTFKVGIDAVVYGKYDGSTFQATELTTKCASKYEAQLEEKKTG
jgi:cytochrome c-type biogenesis protein CcmE